MRTTIIALLLLSTAARAATVRTARTPLLVPSRLEVVDANHSYLTLILKTSSEDGREVTVPIAVPRGMVVTRMTIAMDHQLTVATAYVPNEAGETYDRIVEEIKDPALLEWTGNHRARLRVFPVRRGAPATVTIELTKVDAATDRIWLDRNTSFIAVPGNGEPSPELRYAYAASWPRD